LEDARHTIKSKDAARIGVAQADPELSAVVTSQVGAFDELNHLGNLS
jgi:hypothetical protein